MKWFARTITSKTILVGVENIVYQKAYDVFRQLFVSFDEQKQGEDSLYDYNIIIYYDNSISNSINAPLHNDDLSEYYICCNVMNNQWIFFLLCDLEEIFIHTMDCTVLHGAGLVFRNKTILLLGDRKNGKTTKVPWITLLINYRKSRMRFQKTCSRSVAYFRIFLLNPKGGQKQFIQIYNIRNTFAHKTNQLKAKYNARCPVAE